MRERLTQMIRRAVEAALPWYDPHREAARERLVERHVREAERLALAVQNTSRALRDWR